MKQKLEAVKKEIEERLKVQRELMVQFSELKDEETVGKLKVLSNGYSQCLMLINGIFVG